MDIYIDESNTSGAKFDADPSLYVAAGYYIKNDNDDILSFISNLKNEIKGNDLMTRENNEMLLKVISKFKGINKGLFLFSSRLFYMRERTYDIFYPYELNEKPEIEIIRMKLFSNLYENKFGFLNEIYEKKENESYRIEIINAMHKSEVFDSDEVKILKEFFEDNKKISSIQYTENRHAYSISDLITNVMMVTYRVGYRGEINIFIDDFSNKGTKDIIRSTINHMNSVYKFCDINIKYIDSKSSPELQVADWVASIYRKIIANTLSYFDWKAEKVDPKGFEWLNLIKDSLAIMTNPREMDATMQVSPPEHAFIQLIAKKSNKKIDERINDNLVFNIKNIIDEQTLFETERVINGMDELQQLSKNIIPDLSILDENNSEDSKFLDAIINDSLLGI